MIAAAESQVQEMLGLLIKDTSLTRRNVKGSENRTDRSLHFFCDDGANDLLADGTCPVGLGRPDMLM